MRSPGFVRFGVLMGRTLHQATDVKALCHRNICRVKGALTLNTRVHGVFQRACAPEAESLAVAAVAPDNKKEVKAKGPLWSAGHLQRSIGEVVMPQALHKQISAPSSEKASQRAASIIEPKAQICFRTRPMSLQATWANSTGVA